MFSTDGTFIPASAGTVTCMGDVEVVKAEEELTMAGWQWQLLDILMLWRREKTALCSQKADVCSDRLVPPMRTRTRTDLSAFSRQPRELTVFFLFFFNPVAQN